MAKHDRLEFRGPLARGAIDAVTALARAAEAQLCGLAIATTSMNQRWRRIAFRDGKSETESQRSSQRRQSEMESRIRETYTVYLQNHEGMLNINVGKTRRYRLDTIDPEFLLVFGVVQLRVIGSQRLSDHFVGLIESHSILSVLPVWRARASGRACA